MTNPTLERAARALIQAKHGDAGDSYWEMLDGDAKTLARTMVRAVLMAVREPDEVTVEELFHARDGFVDKQDIAPLHRMVIDLALGESNETDDLTKSAVVSQERA